MTPSPTDPRGRWVAVVTGVISVVLALAYLALVVVLDRPGPLQPPPPEALAGAAAVAPAAAGAPPLAPVPPEGMT